MQAEELKKLVTEIKALKCEHQTIEVKAAHEGCPMRLYDTLSGFSNQDSGGIIVFGLSEKQGFDVIGVYDAQDLQKKVAEQCKQMIPIVRPLFTVCLIDGLPVVAAEIPSVDITERPVYYAGSGKLKGSYIRVGDSDERMSEYEIYSYEVYRQNIRDDQRVEERVNASLINTDALDVYIERIKADRANLAENVSKKDILELMGITRNGKWTLAAIMVFSKYPQALYPQLCITAIVVPGTEIGETGDNNERFIANKRITGTIPEMLNDAVEFVRRNMRVKTIINEAGKRTDQPEFPIKAVREAILNSLVHRDYSIYSENTPIRIEMYSDRMEIINSGGLYGRITIDSLGKVRPETRNATLANILETLSITENRYSGIPTIRYEFKKAQLLEPEFRVMRGEFYVIFKNNIAVNMGELSKAELRKRLIEFCKTPRTRDELTLFTGFTRYYTMKIITPLVEEGAIKLALPEVPKSKRQLFYSV